MDVISISRGVASDIIMDATVSNSTNDITQVITSNGNGQTGTSVTKPTCVVSPYNSVNVSNNARQRSTQLRREKKCLPDNRNSENSLNKRRRNIEASNKPREKREIRRSVLENELNELLKENWQLRNELFAIKTIFGDSEEHAVTSDCKNVSDKICS